MRTIHDELWRYNHSIETKKQQNVVTAIILLSVIAGMLIGYYTNL